MTLLERVTNLIMMHQGNGKDVSANAQEIIDELFIPDLPTPRALLAAPLTLDDVTRHTDALCAEYRQRMVDHQAWYTERVGQLSAAIEASEGLNHMEAGYIFLTKIRELTAPPETVTPKPAPVGEWVDWSGGDRPVPGDTLVTVRLAPEGMEADGYARDIQWDAPSPITAYRVNS